MKYMYMMYNHKYHHHHHHHHNFNKPNNLIVLKFNHKLFQIINPLYQYKLLHIYLLLKLLIIVIINEPFNLMVFIVLHLILFYKPVMVI